MKNEKMGGRKHLQGKPNVAFINCAVLSGSAFFQGRVVTAGHLSIEIKCIVNFILFHFVINRNLSWDWAETFKALKVIKYLIQSV